MGARGRPSFLENPWLAWEFGRGHEFQHAPSVLKPLEVSSNTVSFFEQVGTVVPEPLSGHEELHITPRAVLQALRFFGHIDAESWCLHRPRPSAGVRREESLESKFSRLARQWREETAGVSSPTMISSNSAYLSIIALGRPAIPLILKELRERGGFWYPALRALSGENPVPISARGRPRLMKEAWLAWGRQYELVD